MPLNPPRHSNIPRRPCGLRYFQSQVELGEWLHLGFTLPISSSYALGRVSPATRLSRHGAYLPTECRALDFAPPCPICRGIMPVLVRRSPTKRCVARFVSMSQDNHIFLGFRTRHILQPCDILESSNSRLHLTLSQDPVLYPAWPARDGSAARATPIALPLWLSVFQQATISRSQI